MQQMTLPGELVRKSNMLARGRWQPKSVWEPRIVAIVASKIREDDSDFKEYRIPVDELTGVPDEHLSGTQYTEIARSICNLGEAAVFIQGKRARDFRRHAIFTTVGYEDGHLIAKLHPDLKPHFLNLKEQFTIYSLFEFLTLPSTYSQRIFEILKSWSNCPEVVISVAELHDMLNTPDSLRANFKDFRRRVLEQAHRDITAKTSLRFEWEPMKQRRAVVAVRFVFSEECREEALAVETCRGEGEPSPDITAAAVRALECAKGKRGACVVQDKEPEVCSVCVAMNFCGEMRSKTKN